MKTIDKSCDPNGVSQLDITIKQGTVTIYKSNNGLIQLSGSITGNSSKGVEIKKATNVVYIKQKIGLGFPFKIGFTKIFIGIPSHFDGNLSIAHYGGGKLILKDISVKSLAIKSLVAKLLIDDIVFEDILLKSGTSGSKIDLKRECGNISVNSTVGKVNFNMDKIGGNLEFNGGVSGGSLIIPSDAPVKIINRGNKKDSDRSSSKDVYNFILKPGVGKIKIREKIV